MAQLLVSCFSILLLCVTWSETAMVGEDVLDNLGVDSVEPHQRQPEGVPEDGYSHIVGNETDEQSAPERVDVKAPQENAEAMDGLFSHQDGGGQVGGNIPLSAVGSDGDAEDGEVNTEWGVPEKDNRKDDLDTSELDDDTDSRPEKYAGTSKPEETEDYNEESEDQDASEVSWDGQDILDFINPNVTDWSRNPEEQTEGKADGVQENEQELTTSTAGIYKDILDLLKTDDGYPDEYEPHMKQNTSESVNVPLLVSADAAQKIEAEEEKENDGHERKLSSNTTSPSENAVSVTALYSDDRSDAVDDSVTAQVNYGNFLNKIFRKGGGEDKDYVDFSESEHLNKEFEDYFDGDDDYEEEYSDVSSKDDDLYSDEKSNNVTEVTLGGDANSSIEDTNLDAFGSFHPFSKEQSEASSEHQTAAADDDDDYDDDDGADNDAGAKKEEENIVRGKEDGADEADQDSEESLPQPANQEDHDDDSDDYQIPDYGAGRNYEEDDWYYDPLRNGKINDKDAVEISTTPGGPQNIDQKPGFPSDISVPEFKEDAIQSQDVQQAKKPLAGPTGMILLYTALIVMFIAGIVLITVWKQPFHGWIKKTLAGRVVPAEEGKRLLDHQFV